MKMKNLGIRYSISEGLGNIFNHGFMSIAALGTIISCLVVVGCFYIISGIVGESLKGIDAQVEITVLLENEVSYARAMEIMEEIKAIDNVSSTEFISKQEALDDFAVRVPGVVEGLHENDNPLSDRIVVTVRDMEKYEKSADELLSVEGVARVRADRDVASRLNDFRNLITAMGLALMAILGAVSVFIITNAIRISAFSRKEEIAIMRMVGSTNWFIRGSFLVEGVLLGFIGALIGYFLQWAMFEYAISNIDINLPFIKIMSFGEIAPQLLLGFMGAGLAFGVGGSMIAIRKYLKV